MKYNSAEQLIKLAVEKKLRLCDLALETECKLQESNREKVREEISNVLSIMEEAVEKACLKEVVSVSGLSGGDALKLSHYKEGESFCGSAVLDAVAKAVSSSEVNASMGKIVAFPTAGSCGIVPGALLSAWKNKNLDRERLIDALLTASAVGLIIEAKATLSGAEGGCQAECGAAAAMAAAGLIQLVSDDIYLPFEAAALALKNLLGLVCDPVCGLVEIPCIKRNGFGSAIALVAADMALAGVKSKIPFDEVVDAMSRIGRALPVDLRETAQGGLATTKTGKEYAERLNL